MSVDGTLIERIDAALAGTTPGPWRTDVWGTPGKDAGRPFIEAPHPVNAPIVIASTVNNEANALLIAQAPSLLAESREEIARLREALDTIRRFVKVNAAWPATTNAWVEDYTARALAGTESPTQHGEPRTEGGTDG